MIQKIIVISTIFNLLFSSAYPVFIAVRPVYAQEEDGGNADTEQTASCSEVRQYDECFACNTSRKISQDSCGNYNTLVESQENSVCADWCSVQTAEDSVDVPAAETQPADTSQEDASVVPDWTPPALCQEEVINSCFREDCDNSRDELICVAQIRNSDCSTSFQVAEPTGKKGCASGEAAPVQPSCEEKIVEDCFRKDCDTNLNKYVCVNKVQHSDCSISIDAGGLTDKSCDAAGSVVPLPPPPPPPVVAPPSVSDRCSYCTTTSCYISCNSETASEPVQKPAPDLSKYCGVYDLSCGTSTPFEGPEPVKVVVANPESQKEAIQRGLEREERRAKMTESYFASVRETESRKDLARVGGIRSEKEAVKAKGPTYSTLWEGVDFTGSPMGELPEVVQSVTDSGSESLANLWEKADLAGQPIAGGQQTAEEKRLAEKSQAAAQTAKGDVEATRQALEAALQKPQGERAADLKRAFGLPEDAPDSEVDSEVRAAAVLAGISIDGSPGTGNFTIRIPDSSSTAPLTFREQAVKDLVVGLKLSTDIPPEQALAEYNKQAREKGEPELVFDEAFGIFRWTDPKSQDVNKWGMIGLVGTMAVVTAPVWIPVAAGGAATIGGGIQIATSAVSGATTYSYVTVASTGAVILQKVSPRFQAALGKGGEFLAQTGDIVIPAGICATAIQAGVQTAGQAGAQLVECIREALKSGPAPLHTPTANLPIVGTRGATSAEVAAMQAVDLAGGTSVAGAVPKQVSPAGKNLWGQVWDGAGSLSQRVGDRAGGVLNRGGQQVGNLAGDITGGVRQVLDNGKDMAVGGANRAKGLLSSGEHKLPVVSSPRGSGYADINNTGGAIKFTDRPDYQITLSSGEKLTVSPQALELDGRAIVSVRQEDGKVAMYYISTSEGNAKQFVGVAREDGWFIKPPDGKTEANASMELDLAIRNMLNDKRVNPVMSQTAHIWDPKKQKWVVNPVRPVTDLLDRAGFVYEGSMNKISINVHTGKSDLAIKAMENRLTTVTTQKATAADKQAIMNLDFQKPAEPLVSADGKKMDIPFWGSECGLGMSCNVTLFLDPNDPLRTGAPPVNFTFSRVGEPDVILTDVPRITRTERIITEGGYQIVRDNFYNSSIGQEYLRISKNGTVMPSQAEVQGLTRFVQAQSANISPGAVLRLGNNGKWGTSGTTSGNTTGASRYDPRQVPTISKAQSFDQLYQAIDQTGGLRGSKQTYSPERLKEIINGVRRGSVDIDFVTNTEGLRDSVQRLLQQERRVRSFNLKQSLRSFLSLVNKLDNILGSEVFAAEDNESEESDGSEAGQIISQQEFSYGQSVAEVQEKLEDKGEIDSQEVKQILLDNVEIKPDGFKSGDTIAVTTGSDGTVEFEIEKGVYYLDSLPIEGADVTLSSLFIVDEDAETAGIGIKEGNGQVKRVERTSTVVSPNQNTVSKVRFVTYYDKNNNDKFDNDEDIVPWAGVSVKLTRVDQEKTINLNPGWNLLTLEALSAQPITAATLLANIAAQGGEATTVSTLIDGAWKTYVIRGDKSFSGDDFAIEPGKAYFVKALKKSTFTYTGQNLVAPVKLKLASGWNVVGIPYSQKSYQADTLIEAVNTSGTESDAVSQWDFGLWDTFVKKEEEGYGNNFDIINNKGYLVRVKNEGEWSP